MIILDIGLPHMDGLSLLKQFDWKSPRFKSKVIMLTGTSQKPEVVAAFELGAHDYVVKPFEMGDLIKRVQHALGAFDS